MERPVNVRVPGAVYTLGWLSAEAIQGCKRSDVETAEIGVRAVDTGEGSSARVPESRYLYCVE
eukprot:8604199-Pyramimonas_sp.AAC.1